MGRRLKVTDLIGKEYQTLGGELKIVGQTQEIEEEVKPKYPKIIGNCYSWIGDKFKLYRGKAISQPNEEGYVELLYFTKDILITENKVIKVHISELSYDKYKHYEEEQYINYYKRCE